jgi:hypothetical protein
MPYYVGSTVLMATIDGAVGDGRVAADWYGQTDDSGYVGSGLIFRQNANGYMAAWWWYDTVALIRVTPTSQTLVASVYVGSLNGASVHVELQIKQVSARFTGGVAPANP